MININEWLEIPNYPTYKIKIITNEVKSLNYRRSGKERIMQLGIKKFGHLYTSLSLNGKSKTWQFHQIVMLVKTGHLAPEGLECCHNDGNPQNNHPDNLRYDTASENMKDKYKHGTANNHFQTNHPLKGKFGAEHNRSKPILQFTKEGVFIKEWVSATQVERELGVNQSNIPSCCRGIRKYSGGFMWKYK